MDAKRLEEAKRTAEKRAVFLAGKGAAAKPVDGVPAAQNSIKRLFVKSEPRIPLLVSKVNGDPYGYVDELAKACGSTIEKYSMQLGGDHCDATTVMESILNRGDWMYIDIADVPDDAAFRAIGMKLTIMMPDEEYPKREFFRIWVCTPEPIDVNDRYTPKFPQVFLRHCLCARPIDNAGEEMPTPQKIVRKKIIDPGMSVVESMSPVLTAKKEGKRKFGHDSDSESDTEDMDLFSVTKPFGPLFCHHPIDVALDVHLPNIDRGEYPDEPADAAVAAN